MAAAANLANPVNFQGVMAGAAPPAFGGTKTFATPAQEQLASANLSQVGDERVAAYLSVVSATDGLRTYVTTLIEHRLNAEMNWLLDLFEITTVNDLEVMLTTIEAQPSVMRDFPEESVPNIVQTSVTTEAHRLQRYAIMTRFSLETNVVQGEQFKKQLAINANTIATSFRQRLLLDSIMALERGANRQALVYARRANLHMRRFGDPHQLMTDEISQFLAATKDPRGFENIVDRLSEQLKTNQMTPAVVIVAGGVKHQMNWRDAWTDYSRSGAEALRAIVKGSEAQDKKMGLVVVETQAIVDSSLPEAAVTFADPMSRMAVNGSHTLAVAPPRLPAAAAAPANVGAGAVMTDYSEQAVSIYDEEVDSLVKFTYRDLYEEAADAGHFDAGRLGVMLQRAQDARRGMAGDARLQDACGDDRLDDGMLHPCIVGQFGAQPAVPGTFAGLRANARAFSPAGLAQLGRLQSNIGGAEALAYVEANVWMPFEFIISRPFICRMTWNVILCDRTALVNYRTAGLATTSYDGGTNIGQTHYTVEALSLVRKPEGVALAANVGPFAGQTGAYLSGRGTRFYKGTNFEPSEMGRAEASCFIYLTGDARKDTKVLPAAGFYGQSTLNRLTDAAQERLRGPAFPGALWATLMHNIPVADLGGRAFDLLSPAQRAQYAALTGFVTIQEQSFVYSGDSVRSMASLGHYGSSRPGDKDILSGRASRSLQRDISIDSAQNTVPHHV